MSLDLQFENVFKISTSCWHFTRCHPSIVRNTVWKLQVLVMTIMSFICFNLLTYSIFFHDIKDDRYADATKHGTILIVSITISIKYYILINERETIRDLIKVIDDDYALIKNASDEEKHIVLHYAKRGVRVCKYWIVAFCGTSATFLIKAFVSMIWYYWQGEFKLVPMFELSYIKIIEQNKDVTPIFCGLFLIHLIFASYASIMYVCFDPLTPIFMLHTCGQLDLLSRRLSKLFSETDDPKEIEEELKRIIRKLQLLIRFMDRVKNNFTLLFEFILKTTTLLLPLSAFQVLDGLRNKYVNVEFISFFTASSLHFFIPCYYSDLLVETSENFRQAIYSCGWEKCPDKRVRTTILFMLTRAKTPMAISTIFYIVNLDTFAETCRQSYTIFNLMNAAWT